MIYLEAAATTRYLICAVLLRRETQLAPSGDPPESLDYGPLPDNTLLTEQYGELVMATGQDIVEKAINGLKSSLSGEDERTFAKTSLDDVWQEARKIEKGQGRRLDLRFMRRIEPFLSSLESYAGVLEVFCQGYSPLAWVWVSLTWTFPAFYLYTDTKDRAQ